MMTYYNIKKYLYGLCVGCGVAVTLTACSEWDDHYEGPVTEVGSEPTLWQAIQQRPELSNFGEVLSKTMVYKHHKKTSVSYANLLDGAQTFTVLAPVNGTFNKDSLLDLLTTNRGDSMVVRSFVGNHLSYNLAANSAGPTEFFLLNKKRAVIGNNVALDIPLKEYNIKAKGGIMHVLQNTLPYRHNLYEVMLNDPRFVHLGGQLASYEHDEFNPSQSVEGGMVDGEQIYVDSVFNERNLLLERVGELANEDSTYIFVAPVDAEWQRIWQEAMEYYRYDASVEGGDSLQRFWANYALLNDAIFSRTIQSSPKDSLITYRYDKRYPQYHVFHRPFDEGGILYGCTPTDYSNGTLYTANQWPFTPQMTYHRELKTEGEREGLIVERSLCVTNTRVHAADSVSENEYLVITPTGATSNWKLTYRLEDVLAGNYDICAIILPATVYNSRAQLRPCKFKATINYVDETGASKSFNCDNKQFESNPERVDTVVLAENFHFPVCNYDQSSLKISLRLDCSITARETTRYSREMFLDCIYLRPRKNMTTEQ